MHLIYRPRQTFTFDAVATLKEEVRQRGGATDTQGPTAGNTHRPWRLVIPGKFNIYLNTKIKLESYMCGCPISG